MIIVLTGVAGSGKTTVGTRLAAEIGWPFYDADAFHSRANIEKMRRGRPLTDADREGWLGALAELIRRVDGDGGSAVLACSALKQAYRARLAAAALATRFVYLRGDYETISRRLLARAGHFLPASLLRSQFDALEPPRDALIVDIRQPISAIVSFVIRELGLTRRPP